MKTIALFILPLFLFLGDVKLVKTKVGNDITINLPEAFSPMAPDDIAQRYPSVRKPIGAFTSMDRLVGFSVNVSATKWRASDIEIAKDFFKASVMELYDKVDFSQSMVKEINGMRYIVFEFDSRINGDKYAFDQQDPIRKYNYLQYLLINGKTIVFSFDAPAQLKEQWVDTVPEIMSSVVVKKTI